jgi:hypothetical protein
MKIRILDRILVALAGIVLVAACAGLVAQVFFSVDVIGFVTQLLTAETSTKKVILGAIAGALLIIGLYCLLMLFRHRKRKDKFIIQKLESGDLAISLKTLETMVQKCLDQHQEIRPESIRLENQRDGLLIRIRGTVAGGVSIPLTVDNLQKQVKRYVTACSGVEVKGIRIQIESSGEDAKDAMFAIEPPAGNLLPRGGENPTVKPAPEEKAEVSAEPEAQMSAEPEIQIPREEAAAAAVMTAAESMEDPVTEDMPIHQQLFRTQEEPCIMPLPPEDLESETKTAEAPGDAAAPETAAEPEETETKADTETEKPESAEKAEEPDADKTEGEENK